MSRELWKITWDGSKMLLMLDEAMLLINEGLVGLAVAKLHKIISLMERTADEARIFADNLIQDVE